MSKVYIYNRQTQQVEEEPVYCFLSLRFLYSPWGCWLRELLVRIPWISRWIGWWQTLPHTRKKIPSFVATYGIDPEECTQPLNHYSSFNAFFTRRLRSRYRPIAQGAIIPADGRYQIHTKGLLLIKGRELSLDTLLGDSHLADCYRDGTIIIGRLNPSDCHRFCFPIDCVPGKSHLLSGPLYSVHPFSWHLGRLFDNRRMLTRLRATKYGEVLFLEVGATAVGAIHQTYRPYHPYRKGEEKGYFSFGGSALVLCFLPGRLSCAPDLMHPDYEVRCLLGQSLEST